MAPLFTGIAKSFGFSAASGVEGPPKISATGGTKSTEGGYVFHVFTSSGSLIITDDGGGLDIDYMVCGGGGGGGADR